MFQALVSTASRVLNRLQRRWLPERPPLVESEPEPRHELIGGSSASC
jgi:hypothetical protein